MRCSPSAAKILPQCLTAPPRPLLASQIGSTGPLTRPRSKTIADQAEFRPGRAETQLGTIESCPGRTHPLLGTAEPGLGTSRTGVRRTRTGPGTTRTGLRKPRTGPGRTRTGVRASQSRSRSPSFSILSVGFFNRIASISATCALFPLSAVNFLFSPRAFNFSFQMFFRNPRPLRAAGLQMRFLALIPVGRVPSRGVRLDFERTYFSFPISTFSFYPQPPTLN